MARKVTMKVTMSVTININDDVEVAKAMKDICYSFHEDEVDYFDVEDATMIDYEITDSR
jgi:hypothetical protein